MDSYATMLTDIMHTIPPELLGSLLHEELTGQRDRMLISEEATGGALAFVPFSHGGSGSQDGCLIYPRNGLHLLSILNNIYQIKLFQRHSGLNCCYKMRKSPHLFSFAFLSLNFLMQYFRLPHSGTPAPERRPLMCGCQEPPSL